MYTYMYVSNISAPSLNNFWLRHCVKPFISKHVRFNSASFITRQSRKYHSPTSFNATPALFHAKCIRDGKLLHLPSANHLLNLYVKHNFFQDAHKLFDEMPYRDVQTWSILISDFAKRGSIGAVLRLFNDMREAGVWPNKFTLSSVLKCCAKANQVGVGKVIHGWMLSSGAEIDAVLENSVLDLYIKCGAFELGKRLFQMMEMRDSVSWNIVIFGCFQVGDDERAVELFREMPCKDVWSWNTVIDGLVRSGSETAALKLLREMLIVGRPLINTVTFSIALVLASALMDLQLGRQLHVQILKCHAHGDGVVVNSLVHMYSKCGEVRIASLVLGNTSQNKMAQSINHEDIMDAAAWSSMISGCVQNGMWDEAMEIFCKMVRDNLELHMFILTSVLSACASAGQLVFGKLIHAFSVKLGYRPDVTMYCALIDMYSKCGSLDDARSIFQQANDRNVVLWTALISCYALNGNGLEATHLFDSMVMEGISPNAITFISVLTACIHAGLVEHGCLYFTMMKDLYGIKPEPEHFTCMVDLYGRANRLEEAKHFILQNDLSSSVAAWSALLSSCRFHKNFEMAKLATKHLETSKSTDAGTIVMLSNLCANEQRWDDCSQIRSSMKQKGIKKFPGQSWIQL